MKKLIVIAAVCSALAASAEVAITGVTARQRWPWNNLVDIDFTIQGAAAGEAFAIGVEAEWAGGAKKVVGTTFSSEPVASSGANRITWDFGADCPNTVAADCRISVTATPISDSAAIYMVIDLSGGSSATVWPVRYTLTPPAHVKGASGEPCQTTELWLRRVCAKGRTFRINSYDVSGVGVWAQQTNDFYMAIFETTQQQWYQMTGSWPAYCVFTRSDCRASRPCDKFVINDLRGKWNWPDDKSVSGNSVLQRLRSKTGLATIDLPTLAQWQYAVAGGPMKSESSRYGAIEDIARYAGNNGSPSSSQYATCDETQGTAFVGTYEPNSLGLYDMLGNVSEIVIDPYMTYQNLGTYYKTTLGVGGDRLNPALEPEGAPQESSRTQPNMTNGMRVYLKGGAYNSSEGNVTYFNMSYQLASDHYGSVGFRFAVTSL